MGMEMAGSSCFRLIGEIELGFTLGETGDKAGDTPLKEGRGE